MMLQLPALLNREFIPGQSLGCAPTVSAEAVLIVPSRPQWVWHRLSDATGLQQLENTRASGTRVHSRMQYEFSAEQN